MIECTRCLYRHEEKEEDCPNPAQERLLLVNTDYEPVNPSPTPTKLEIARLLQCPINWRELAPAGIKIEGSGLRFLRFSISGKIIRKVSRPGRPRV